jgi:hypothetical protein
LKYPNEEIIRLTISAFEAFCSTYYADQQDQFKKQLVEKYIKGLHDADTVAVRRGYCLALGCLPTNMIVDKEQVRLHLLS